MLVFALILGADDLAYYGLLLIVLQFGVNFSQWGVMTGLNVELPLALGGVRPTRTSSRLEAWERSSSPRSRRRFCIWGS